MAYVILIKTRDLSSCFFCKTAQDVLILTQSLRDKKARILITDLGGAILSVSEFYGMFFAEKRRALLKAKTLEGLRDRLQKGGLRKSSERNRPSSIQNLSRKTAALLAPG
jgi:hypothetical protein